MQYPHNNIFPLDTVHHIDPTGTWTHNLKTGRNHFTLYSLFFFRLVIYCLRWTFISLKLYWQSKLLVWYYLAIQEETVSVYSFELDPPDPSPNESNHGNSNTMTTNGVTKRLFLYQVLLCLLAAHWLYVSWIMYFVSCLWACNSLLFSNRYTASTCHGCAIRCHDV